MRIAVLGTGMVGRALAGRLVELGHEVMMGSRTAGNEHARAWAESAGARAHEGSFADAAAFGQLVVNATSGHASLEALQAAGPGNLAGKVLVDVANPIQPDSGMPPALSVCNTESLAEQIQAAHPRTRVVKTLNTVNAVVMRDPSSVPGDHVIFITGDDAAAKEEVLGLLENMGWPRDRVLDLGGIEQSRGPEMYLALWLRLLRSLGSPRFNIALQRG